LFLDRFIFNIKENISPLNFFQDIQFAFASTIQADKADAACFDNFIKIQNKEIIEFSKIFNDKLELYLNGLQQNSDLNVVRTEIRNIATNNIKKGLEDNQRVFELTSPTGSGKTLMLLSLASEIIKIKGAKRIIYSLPFLSITEQVEQEVLKIFKGYESFIQRIDSKSENKRLEKLQEELDNNPEVGKDYNFELLEFQENTFSYPMVITTFVRFIETLLSNKNAELLKLPNFSHCIFLLDEIQALPPRLYSFL
jgi:Predicted helicases